GTARLNANFDSFRRPASRLALFMMIAGCAPAATHAQSIPFIYDDARLFVPVHVSSDTTTYWFILDSGAQPTIIDANVAAALGLKVREAGSVTGAGTHSLRQGRAQGVSLSVGGVALGPMEVRVSEIDSLLAPSQGRGAPGIIGSRFFIEHVVEIDFGSSLVTLHAARDWRYDGSGTVLPLTLDNGVPMTAGRMTTPDGTVIPMRLLVDLGAKSTLLVAEPFIDEHRLMRRFAKTVTSPLGAGVGGATRYAFARLPRLALGGAGGALPTDSLVAGLSVGGTLRSTRYDALLGADFLRRYRVIFDYAHHQLILEPRTPPVPVAEYDMSGMFLLAEGADRSRYVVGDLVKGGPADEAGIEVGDELISLDGQPTAAITLGSVRHRLKAGEGRVVRVEVGREGARTMRLVRLRRLI
ncbi:MAG TPA: aspartyl protease family protein, partial [Gemmatimonadaceae bacterium]|nr:aspartyl protease family protein [Gemmatimonadaceae bacterium]